MLVLPMKFVKTDFCKKLVTAYYFLLYYLEMAKLTRDDVLKLAQLSRLHLTDDEIEHFTEEITAILGYVEQLQKVDITGLEPTYQVTGLKNVMRPDELVDYEAKPADLLKNSPSTEAGHIKVKRMLQ